MTNCGDGILKSRLRFLASRSSKETIHSGKQIFLNEALRLDVTGFVCFMFLIVIW